MNHRGIRERLEDHLDGSLAPAEAEAVDRHLAGCPECAAALAALADLRRRARALPAELEPPRDLWPGIESRLGLERPEELETGVAPGRTLRWPWALAAAAALAVAVLSLALLTGRDRSPLVASEGPPPPVAGIVPAVQALDSQVRGASKELVAAVQEGPGSLRGPVAEAMEENLRILDRAMDETRSALAEEPQNARLIHALTALYERKLALLHEATDLALRRAA